MKKNILIVITIFLAILAVAVFFFVKNENNKKDTLKPTLTQEHQTLLNNKIPDVSIKNKNNEDVKLSEFNNGKPTFIMYWASWCPDCRKQLPEVEKLYKNYKDKVNFVLINAADGERETSQKAKAYIKENGLTFDYYKTTDESLDAFKVKKIPTKFIAGKDNNIQDIQVEKFTSYEDMKDKLDKLL